MTDEAHGYNSEDAPARPASTRWSDDGGREDAAQDDGGLAPPYVPGRRAPEAASPSTAAASPSSTDTAPDDDFPFDEFDIDGDSEPASSDAPTGAESATWDEPDGAEDFEPEEFESEEFGAEDFATGSDEMAWSPEDLDDDASFGEWTPGYEDDDRSAVDAELEPITDEPPVEEVEAADEVQATDAVEAAADPSEQEPDHRFKPDGSIESGPSENVEEVAAVLDRLAGLLRDEGEDAVRREMESEDRLTALVSSLLSGHLAARR